VNLGTFVGVDFIKSVTENADTVTRTKINHIKPKTPSRMLVSLSIKELSQDILRKPGYYFLFCFCNRLQSDVH